MTTARSMVATESVSVRNSTKLINCILTDSDDTGYWQRYCPAQGPFWFLCLLDDYSIAFSSTYGGEYDVFPLYDMIAEGDTRKFLNSYGEEAELSDAGHQALALRWMWDGIDGNFRPLKISGRAAYS